jgi:hypothetical protein
MTSASFGKILPTISLKRYLELRIGILNPGNALIILLLLYIHFEK